uniref:Secreted protein n=1 Tax=Physcomitrium patens TaxID=3218 RepID=A0A2K1IV93_PHYPA|nr:hypothetical protein PHYPA_025134 [Physcomitrium patens]
MFLIFAGAKELVVLCVCAHCWFFCPQVFSRSSSGQVIIRSSSGQGFIWVFIRSGFHLGLHPVRVSPGSSSEQIFSRFSFDQVVIRSSSGLQLKVCTPSNFASTSFSLRQAEASPHANFIIIFKCLY